ncbi:hypothetical protein GIB67_020632, partial [Kingdonia uniflora]
DSHNFKWELGERATSFFEHSILVVAFKFTQNHSQEETSLAEVRCKRIDAFLVDPWYSNLG